MNKGDGSHFYEEATDALARVPRGHLILARVHAADMLEPRRDVDVLAKHFLADFQQKHNYSSVNARATKRMRSACERAKIALSSAWTTTIEIDSLYDGMLHAYNLTKTCVELKFSSFDHPQGFDFYETLRRSQFESLCKHRVQKSPEQMDTLKDDSTEFDSFPLENGAKFGGVVSWRDVYAVPMARIIESGTQRPTVPPTFFDRPSFIGEAGAGIIIKDSPFYSKRQVTERQVRTLFDRTMNDHIITNIEWLNTDHFGYEINMKLKCDEMRQKRERIETIQWHGASTENLRKIAKNGFDRWFGSLQVHGPGTYFADEATTSHGYSERPQRGPPFMMMLSKVLIGEGIRSDTFSKNQKEAVTFQTRANLKEVDSVRGDFLDRSSEQITVSYRDTHSMPIALVTYDVYRPGR